MRMRKFLVLTSLGLIGFGVTANAHHAFSSVFDPATSVNLMGTVTKIDWMNPHVWFYIDVDTDDDTAGNWGFEMGSPNTLVRRGWNHDDLKIGDVVIVSGALARDGSKRAAVRRVTLRSGEQLFGGQDESR